MPYNGNEHVFRLASWAAARAAMRGHKGGSVQNIQTLFRNTFGECLLLQIKQLPEYDDFDCFHRKLCIELVKATKENSNPIVDIEKRRLARIRYGRAAKLLNCYLKVAYASHYLCNTIDPKITAFHPPIDKVLLKTLATENFADYGNCWDKFANKPWSKFTGPEYRTIIEKIKKGLRDQPLWQIEEHWQGHQ